MPSKKRDKREVRMATLHTFYQSCKAGMFDPTDPKNNLAIAKGNIEYSNQLLYTSELEKFQEKYPAVDMDDFVEFLTETGALRKSGKKGGTGAGMPTRLNTPEAAVERGVAPENIPVYIGAVENIYSQLKVLKSVCTIPLRYTFALSGKKDSQS